MARITDIRQTLGNRRCRIFLDGDEWRTTSRGVIRELGIALDDERDPNTFLTELNRAERTAAHARALRILKYRDHSRSELSTKLGLDGYSDALVAETVSDMQRLGFVDDIRVADVLARSLIHVKEFGRIRVSSELRRRGIAEETIISTVDAYAPRQNEESRAIKIAARLLSTGKDDSRVYSRLARLGFEYDIVRRAVHIASENVTDHEK